MHNNVIAVDNDRCTKISTKWKNAHNQYRIIIKKKAQDKLFFFGLL